VRCIAPVRGLSAFAVGQDRDIRAVEGIDMLGGLDVSLTITLVTSTAAVLAWYRGQTIHAYERQNAYQNLLKSIEQVTLVQKETCKEIDELGDRINRVEMLLNHPPRSL
jgi:hypothetical protein